MAIAKLGWLALWVVGIIGGLLLIWLAVLAVSALLVKPRKEYDTCSPYYRFLLDSATGFSMKLLGICVQVEGEERLPETGRFLLVGNHRSNFDPIVTWYALENKNLAFISKPENFRIPIFGRIIRRCGFLPIDRENPRNAFSTIHKAAKLLKKDQVCIGVYPEGTRSKEGILLPFHNGVFKIAQKANVPIVVVAIQGTEQIHKNIFRRRSHVRLTIADVISPEEVSKSRTAEIGQRVENTLSNMLADKEGTNHAEL